MSAAQPPRRPWPLKWIVLAIVLAVVPYTFLRWHYRKPGRSFEPYHDVRDRANTARLLSAGFQRITVEASRPIDRARHTSLAPVAAVAGGLPELLAATLVDRPRLPAEILNVAAGSAASAMLSYPIEFGCTVPDNRQQLGGAQLYVQGGSIFIVPSFERLDGGLLARSRESFVRVVVPPGELKPGHYRVTLIGARSSKSWSLEVR